MSYTPAEPVSDARTLAAAARLLYEADRLAEAAPKLREQAAAARRMSESPTIHQAHAFACEAAALDAHAGRLEVGATRRRLEAAGVTGTRRELDDLADRVNRGETTLELAELDEARRQLELADRRLARTPDTIGNREQVARLEKELRRRRDRVAELEAADPDSGEEDTATPEDRAYAARIAGDDLAELDHLEAPDRAELELRRRQVADLAAARAGCPDCGNPWTPSASAPRCPSCGLSLDDLEAAADFLERRLAR